MFTRNCQPIERRKLSRLPARIKVNLSANASNDFCFISFRGKHSTEKQEPAALYGFGVGSERLRRSREVNTELFQSLLGTWPSRLVGVPCGVLFHLRSPFHKRVRRTDENKSVKQKQLDEGIGNTLVSGVDLPVVLDRTPFDRRKMESRTTYEGIADTFVQLFSSQTAGSIASVC